MTNLICCSIKRFTIIFIYLNCLLLLSYSQITKTKWNWLTDVVFGPYLPDPVSLDNIISKEILQDLKWGCISGTDAAHHSNNRFYEITNKSEALQDLQFLRGTTVWINEHLAVGHAMYDLFLIELLQTQSVDRIVLQRAACVNANQCNGAGTWDGWFQGYFTAILNAFRPNETIPIYLRWRWQDHSGTPYYLSPYTLDGYLVNKPKPTPIEVLLNDTKLNQSIIYSHITYTAQKCFERMFTRLCNTCALNGMSESTINRFKQSAYSLVKKKPLLTLHFDNNPGPIYVVLAYRGNQASRHIENINLIMNVLNDQLVYPLYHITYFLSSHYDILYEHQIDLVARAHIVISEHGAFQSNIIYMRKGSLYIELRGNYEWGEFINFEKLANLFGVYYAHVITTGLVGHGYDQFNITQSECEEVANIVKLYKEEKPYMVNMKS